MPALKIMSDTLNRLREEMHYLTGPSRLEERLPETGEVPGQLKPGRVEQLEGLKVAEEMSCKPTKPGAVIHAGMSQP